MPAPAQPTAPAGFAISDTADASEQEADGVAAGLDRADKPVHATPLDAGSFRRIEPPSVVQDVLASSGHPLGQQARAWFEPRFRRDFSTVRVHCDARAGQAARALGARAYTSGHHIVFGEGQYHPGSAGGRRLLGHELTHVVQQGGQRGLLQRSPLSDSVKAAWDAEPKLEALLARLSQPDVQAAQGDADVDAEIARLLASRPDDLWVARKIRARELGKTTGEAGPKDPSGKPVARPVQAHFFRGSTDRRALVIAGVHGSERQGMEVVEMLLADLAKQPKPPVLSVIVVPTLFPDSKAKADDMVSKGKSGMDLQAARESVLDGKTLETNRNFPVPSKDLAASRDAGGKPKDALGNDISPENQMLMELMERFRPERIITVHGTWDPGAAGVFYDPRALREDESNAAWRTGPRRSPSWESEGYGDARNAAERELHKQREAEMLAAASKTDLDLSLKTAAEIDKATSGIKGRESRGFGEGDKAAKRAKHPSVAGNVGKSGNLDVGFWGGGTKPGVSLGRYAPPRGISVFTVEPPLNYRSDDPKRLDKLTAAARKLELKAYADAIRTILLGS
ncbi:DUF4157 domain-containing protein [Sphingomonas sp. DG1-23]|uniref:eCIS core domain-containing protein n=1 Tax=Sphingomonas sp. DG1-23 TaxID=3068316 RepID=UPI00273E4694|nr:DUF4157 domain-containing protein [Sphingomonas sp. DG1-23]MDP5279471.1 DUF4157 domain-containing protein [Sphingomonas sp. DG1-23]